MKGMTSCRPPEKSNESEIKSNESEMDLINRWDAIEAVKNAIVTVLYHDAEPVEEAMEEAIEATKRSAEASIEALPSVKPEIVMCKDCKKHNVSVGYQKDCCPLYEFRGMSYGHEHDYQFCCFAERRTDGLD